MSPKRVLKVVTWMLICQQNRNLHLTFTVLEKTGDFESTLYVAHFVHCVLDIIAKECTRSL